MYRVSGFGLLMFAMAVLSAGCLNTASTTPKKTTSNTASASSSSSGTAASGVCALFSDNSKDYATCLSCVSSYGTGASNNTIIECVHTNVRTIGGTCIIPSCGSGQIVDFTTCSCRSATAGGGGTTQPGYEDQLTPFLRVGFFAGTYYCNPSTGSDKTNCVEALTTTSVDAHKYSTLSPVNVHQDIGYIRWDLGLDASQYGVGEALNKGDSFFGTFSTVIGTHTFEYRLKPNTFASSNTVQWQDCVEHFGGSENSQVSTLNRCDLRSSSVAPGAPAASSVNLTSTTNSTGIGSVERLSMNGTAANRNLIHATPGSTSSTENGNSIALHGLGLLKYNDDNGANFQNVNSGLFSNIGYYKYSWGPFAVENSSGNSLSSSGTVTSTTALLTSLNFAPVSAVESTAFSPAADDQLVESRTCSHSSDPCVVTAIYRTSGGAVAMQHFSPKLGTTHASSVSNLPGAVTAVGTPKVIEDTSQLSTTTVTTPARLRAFVRATDGNIYMSHARNQQWGAWTSLGRPWMCSADDGAVGLDCSAGTNSTDDACCRAATFSTRSYGAYVEDYTALDELAENNGISIAGDPVVLSYMDTTGTNPIVEGYIMVLVRVSHLLSSTGTLGKYHNAVFYNYAWTGNAFTTEATSDFYFDTISNWSGWMPVKDADGHVFKIQGDPVGGITDIGAAPGTIYAHIFGTQLDDTNSTATPGSGTGVMHPPIGPSSGDNVARDPDTERYFNYGNVIVRTTRILSVAVPASGTENDFANSTDWNDIAADARTGNSAISSNLGFYMGSATGYIVANQLMSATYSDGSNTTPLTYTKRASVYRYDVSVAGTPTTSAPAGEGAEGQNFTSTNFIGTPHPAYVGAGSNHTSLDGIGVGTITSADRVFLVGRSTCPSTDGGTTYPCDRAIPAVTYLRFDETTANDDDAVVYYNGVAHDRDTDTYSTSTIRVRPVIATSDVIPVYSNGLSLSGADVPLYLFVRNHEGKLTMGRFLRYGGGTSGTAIWDFIVTGGFVN